ncbi:hypothetical protein ACLQ8T_05685 [Glutamicibacter sp. FR1]|uniref:hypothetical protein n=1 Tax=Glutamicibacter sp. FR1 TaxID=3393744 RepID=UPI0039AEFBB7
MDEIRGQPMGADEKHAATYHGGKYTPTKYMPTTDDLRDLWVDSKLDHLPRHLGIPLVPTVQAEFDRWLETVRAEAKAEAWDACSEAWEQAHSLDNIEPWGYLPDNPYKENQS